jgi:hypothetical protein
MPAMTNALPPLTKDLIDAFAASAVLWLTRLLGVVTDPSAPRRRRLLTRFVRSIERCVEHIIFLMAVERFGPPPQRRHAPRSTPPGFRRTRGDFRLFWKIARIRAHRRASLIARLAQLFRALAHPEPHIARFTRELAKGLRHSSLIACAPPAAHHAADAPHGICAHDTS